MSLTSIRSNEVATAPCHARHSDHLIELDAAGPPLFSRKQKPDHLLKLLPLNPSFSAPTAPLPSTAPSQPPKILACPRAPSIPLPVPLSLPEPHCTRKRLILHIKHIRHKISSRPRALPLLLRYLHRPGNTPIPPCQSIPADPPLHEETRKASRAARWRGRDSSRSGARGRRGRGRGLVRRRSPGDWL